MATLLALTFSCQYQVSWRIDKRNGQCVTSNGRFLTVYALPASRKPRGSRIPFSRRGRQRHKGAVTQATLSVCWRQSERDSRSSDLATRRLPLSLSRSIAKLAFWPKRCSVSRVRNGRYLDLGYHPAYPEPRADTTHRSWHSLL